MSYDIEFGVAVRGEDNVFVRVYEPKHANITYNLGKLFRHAMDWDFTHREWYSCDKVIKYVGHGIRELHENSAEYEKDLPKNGWGTLDAAVACLTELYDYMSFHKPKNVSLGNLYMRW